MQIKTKLEKLVIDYNNNSMQIRVQDYAVDEQGQAFPLMGRNNTDTLLPGDESRLGFILNDVSDQGKLNQVNNLKSELWTKEVIDARYMREGKQVAGVEDKPVEEWTNEEKEAFNNTVPEQYRVEVKP